MKKFIAYEKGREINKEIHRFLSSIKLTKILSDQLSRASISIVLNIAEGNYRYTNKDKARFMTIALGSTAECVAIFDILEDLDLISKFNADYYRTKLTEEIKILTTLTLNLKGVNKN